MDKIRIDSFSNEIVEKKGFDEVGCYGCSCKDACCKYGADIDINAYKKIIEKRELVESLIDMKIEDCIEEDDEDPEFLGGSAKRSKVVDGFCAFHLREGKGCALFKLNHDGKADRDIIPSICRLYPLNWEKGRLYFDEDIEDTCNCLTGNAKRSIMETQLKDAKEIFILPELLISRRKV
jgi:Fe-S-cluster containining protein